ncbi:MAG: FAD:protein FMN transferase, partial [Acidimicrobiia bacterium]|nr:FAD:protein FMN transferase [Acidimicrobiia bacterium]
MGAVVRARFAALGSEATVAVSHPAGLSEAEWVVLGELDAVDKACSRFRPDSELTAVNAAAGAASHAGPLLREALHVARRAAAVTDGDVDPTIGAALRLLGYDRDFGSVPRRGRPVARFGHVPGWRCIEIDDSAATVRVPPGVQLDLGATAKALAADRAARLAAEAVGCGVLVGLGGDVAVAGAAPGDGWAVAVADWHGVGLDDVA